MYNDKYRWQFCCTSARSSSTQCGLQVGVGLAGNYVSCIFLYQMLSGTDPDNAAIPYLTAVSSSQNLLDPFEIEIETLKTFKRYLVAISPSTESPSMWKPIRWKVQRNIKRLHPQFGDLLGTAFLLLAFLALTAVGDPFVTNLQAVAVPPGP